MLETIREPFSMKVTEYRQRENLIFRDEVTLDVSKQSLILNLLRRDEISLIDKIEDRKFLNISNYQMFKLSNCQIFQVSRYSNSETLKCIEIFKCLSSRVS